MKPNLPLVLNAIRRPSLVVGLMVVMLAIGTSAQVIEGTSRPTDLNLIWRATELSFIQSELRVVGDDEVLDAEETLEIRLPLVNLGPGKAYNVRVTARLVDPPEYVTGGVERFLPVMMPGDTEIVSIPIKAGELAKTGTVRLRIDHSEKYDRLASPVGIDIPVRAMPIPQLVIYDSGIDDDLPENIGRNPNSRVEVGERVQLRLQVANKGYGEARAVKVSLAIPPGLLLIGGRPTKTPGDIAPGQSRIVDFVFDVPRSYRGDRQLSFYLDLVDGERSHFRFRDTVVLQLDAREKSTRDLTTIALDVPSEPIGGLVIGDEKKITVDVDNYIPRAREDNPNAWAVIIGNRNYIETYLELKNAHNDARVMIKYAKSALGIPNDHIVSMEDAGINELKRVFGSKENPERMLAANVREYCDVFVYYSGHGHLDDENRKPYLLPVDCYPKEVEENGYSLELLLTHLSKLKARSVVVVIDACFSGNSSVGPLVKHVAAPGKKYVDFTLAAKDKRMAIFSAASNGEEANVYDVKRHMIFTYFFLKGLQGAADLNGNGEVTAGEMQTFVSDNNDGVPGEVRRIFDDAMRQQRPKFQGDSSLVLRGAVR